MPVGRLCTLAAGLLLGLLLLLPSTVANDTVSTPGPGAQKAGVCPELPKDSTCTQECLSDGDCEDNRKCCQAGCSAACTVPNEKPGTCPSVDLPTLGICEDQCQVDSQCPGQMKCCRNGCGRVSCVTPRF